MVNDHRVYILSDRIIVLFLTDIGAKLSFLKKLFLFFLKTLNLKSSLNLDSSENNLMRWLMCWCIICRYTPWAMRVKIQGSEMKKDVKHRVMLPWTGHPFTRIHRWASQGETQTVAYQETQMVAYWGFLSAHGTFHTGWKEKLCLSLICGWEEEGNQSPWLPQTLVSH